MPGHRLLLRPMSKPGGHSALAIHTAAFVHALVLLAAGFALCFGESMNLTWLYVGHVVLIMNQLPRRRRPPAIHTAEFVHVLVVLAAGLALCYGETINLT